MSPGQRAQVVDIGAHTLVAQGFITNRLRPDTKRLKVSYASDLKAYYTSSLPLDTLV